MRRDGFTLLELIVVISIAAIVMGTALPRIASAMKRSPVTGGATALSGDLRMAQAMAGRTRQPIRVSVDPSGKVVRLRDYATPATMYNQRYFTTTSEYSLTTLSTTDTLVLVYPNGTTDGPVTFTLRSGDQQRTVQMTRAGMIRIGS